MAVHVRIADAAAVQDQRVIQERAVAFRRRLQLLEVVGEERHVERVDLRHARDLLRIVAVVRQRVMRIGHADLGIGAVARLARELERHDARDVALHRQHLQVEHQRA
jgi:hypothetical protein